MLKKARAEKEAEAAGTDARDLAKTVLDSSRQIWLAGLGAFSRAQAEGTKVFEALVRQGEEVETRTRQAASDTATAARAAAEAKAREMQEAAGGTWDKLEKVFEDRVARALSRLGVHTQADVERLTARVDALAEAVNELIKTSGRSRRAVASQSEQDDKAAAARSAARKRARKRSVGQGAGG